MRLYEVTGEQRYLDLAEYFVTERGRQPYIFDIQADENAKRDADANYKPNTDPNRYAYHQANKPATEQDEAVGHAVRAGYFYSGLADVARLTDDQDLADAAERLWRNIVDKKLYVTGGIGGTVILRTRRPLDMESNTGFASIEGTSSDTSSGVDPQASALYSWHSKDERFGLLVGATRQNRTNRSMDVTTEDWQWYSDRLDANGNISHDYVWNEAGTTRNPPVDAHGNPSRPLELADLGDDFKVIFCFQHGCPGGHSHGFPTLKAMVEGLSGQGFGFGLCASNAAEQVLNAGKLLPCLHDARCLRAGAGNTGRFRPCRLFCRCGKRKIR